MYLIIISSLIKDASSKNSNTEFLDTGTFIQTLWDRQKTGGHKGESR